MAGVELSVNIDHVATLRQARRGVEPEPVAAAMLAELAGAHGITVHLRTDRRHVQERDLYLLREATRLKLNVEIAMTPEGLKVLREVKPELVTLVPERPEEVTTEGGLDLAAHREEVEEYVRLYRESGMEVSLFIDPDVATVRLAGKLSPEYVELNTLEYGQPAPAAPGPEAALERIAGAARIAAGLGLEVHAGHDLNYRNVPRLIAAVPEISEVSIGHAIIARAALVGMERAVKDMLAALGSG